MLKRIFEKEKKTIIFAGVGVLLIIIALIVGQNLEKNDDTEKVYADYRDKIQGWLVKNVQNGDGYIINLGINSGYEVIGENGVTRKSSTRRYKISANRADRTAKIELNGSDVFNPAFARLAFGERLDKALYLDMKSGGLSIYLPQGDGYKKYEYNNKELNHAVDAILFPDNINIPLDSIFAATDSYGNGVKSSDTIQAAIDSAPFYKPFYIFTGEQPKEQAALSVFFSYSISTGSVGTMRVRENRSQTLNLVHMAYRTVTGEDYAKTYEGMNLMDESMDVIISPDSQMKIELPKADEGIIFTN